MFILLSLFATCIAIYIKPTVWVYIMVYSLAFLAYSAALDGSYLGWWEYMYVKNSVSLDMYHIYYWLVMLFSLAIYVMKLNSGSVGPLYISTGYLKYLLFISVIFFVISVSTAYYNFKNVGNIELFFLAPREWEHSFGSSAVRNYLYFLYLPGIVSTAIVLHYSKGVLRLFSLLIMCGFLSITLLHGIKFTIIHGFMFLIFALFSLNRERFPAMLFGVAALLVFVISVYFLFVRGGGAQGIVGYVFSASVNSLMYISENPILNVKVESLIPINSDMIFHIIGRMLSEPFTLPPVSERASFILNDVYNLQNSISIIGWFGFFYLVLSYLFAALVNRARKVVLCRVSSIFIVSFLLYGMLMLFTAWEFAKFKLFVMAVVVFSVDFFYKMVFRRLFLQNNHW